MAALMVALLAAPPGQADPRQAPSIAVEPDQFDFGSVKQQRTVSKQFRIRNFGSQSLSITRITASCGCSAWKLEEGDIEPGQGSDLRVSLETGDELGRVEHTVLIESNDPERPKLSIRLYATIVD
jgi:hypothetical protein